MLSLPLAPRHAARLMVLAARRAGTLRLLYDEDQPRDERGQWTDGGGDSSATGTITSEKGATQEQQEKVARRSKEVAERMGVSPSIINVVDKEPREFIVGNKQFREAAHYDPRTNEIEMNARMTYDDRMSVTNGIAAHEVSHAIFQAARDTQEKEHREIQDLPSTEYKRLYRASGYAREETQAEIHERWPVSATFYKYTGDSYMETEKEAERFSENVAKLEKEDGVSEYSKAYWQKEALNLSNGRERAIDETLAEVARYHITDSSDVSVNKIWRDFSSDLRSLVSHPSMKPRLSGKRAAK